MKVTRKVGVPVLVLALVGAWTPGSVLTPAQGSTGDEKTQWAGTITVTSTQAWSITPPDSWVTEFTGTYSQLRPVGESGYQSKVVMSSKDTQNSFCSDGVTMGTTLRTFSFSGDSTAKVLGPDSTAIQFGNEGVVFDLHDTEKGTFFRPNYGFFSANQSNNCPGGPYTGKMSADALSYQVGYGSVLPDTPLIDLDPDPARLVGTTTYGLGTIPGGAAWNYTNYSYKIEYDLTRTTVKPTEPPPSQDCVKGKSKSKTVRLNARTPLKLAPDRNWFDFKVKASWCRTEAGTYKLTKVNPKGKVDKGPGGIVGKALGVFGFEPKYLSDTESVAPTPPTTFTSASGSFAMCFSLVKLYDKLGLKKKLRDKLQSKLEKKIAKVFRKQGVKRLEPRAVTAVRHRVANHANSVKDKMRTAIDEIDDMLRKARLPDSVSEFLEDVVEEPFVYGVDWAVERFGDGLANRQNATPEELADDFFDLLEAFIDERTRWCDADPIPGNNSASLVMWTPTVGLSVTADGSLSHSYGNAYKHPALKVSDKT